MTATAVATNGFGVPNIQGAVGRDPNPPIVGGEQNLPPLNPQPGFNVPPANATAVTSQPQQQLPQTPAAQVQPQPQVPQVPVQQELEELSGVPTKDLRSYDVGQIDDPVIASLASSILASDPSIDLDRALAKAIQFGNADLVDEAYLREAGGKSGANLVVIAKSLVTQIAAKAEANTQAIYALAGGPEGWNQAVAAFNQFAPADQRTALAELLDSGNPKWIQYAANAIVSYSKQSGAIPVQGTTVQSGQASVSSAQALNKQQFQAELAKLNTQAPDYAQQYSALAARRQQGKQLGLQ